MNKNKKNDTLELLKASQAARRKAEIAAGIRTDRRFVGKTIPSRRRKMKDKEAKNANVN